MNYDIFSIVSYHYPGWTILSECKSLLEAQEKADKFFVKSGFKNSVVVEYGGEIVYRAQRRSFLGLNF